MIGKNMRKPSGNGPLNMLLICKRCQINYLRKINLGKIHVRLRGNGKSVGKWWRSGRRSRMSGWLEQQWR
jgi:hypothetical protein